MILMFFVHLNILSFPVLPAIFVLNLNKGLLLLSAGISAIALLAIKNGLFLQYCYKFPNFLECWSLYSIKLYIDINTLMSLVLSICVLSVSLIQSVNGAQFFLKINN